MAWIHILILPLTYFVTLNADGYNDFLIGLSARITASDEEMQIIYSLKLDRPQISNLSLHIKELEKQE
jgi:hypothetical protein